MLFKLIVATVLIVQSLDNTIYGAYLFYFIVSTWLTLCCFLYSHTFFTHLQTNNWGQLYEYHNRQLYNLLPIEWKSNRVGCIGRASSISRVNCLMAPKRTNLHCEIAFIDETFFKPNSLSKLNANRIFCHHSGIRFTLRYYIPEGITGSKWQQWKILRKQKRIQVNSNNRL